MVGVLWVVLVPALVGFVYMIFCHYLPFIQQMKRAPPGRMGWPLVGETLAFLKPHHPNSRGKFLNDRCKRYGNVFKSHLFGSPTIFSCDPELNAFVLQNENRLFQLSYPKPVHDICGSSSLISIVGDEHKRLRSHVLNLVNAVKSKHEFLANIEKNALLVINSWKDKQTVIFCDESRKFTFNIIVKQMLSLTPENPLSARLLHDFATFMKGFVSMPINIPGTRYAKAVKARQSICSVVKMIMEERSGQGSEYKPSGDLLDMLMVNDTVKTHEIFSLVLDIMLAGHETTYALLAVIVHCLSDSQLPLQQLKAEHEMIASTKHETEPLDLSHYKQMTFTQQVINEGLRYGNVVKFVHRKALKDVKFKDFQIPAGWKVLPVLAGVHLDESLHENALEFNPWRWQGSYENPFMPFGGGLRLCPGYEVAKLESAFFIHHLILNFRWKVHEWDCALAYPYIEFEKGLPIVVEHLIGKKEK